MEGGLQMILSYLPKSGEKSEDVKKLQIALKEKGFDPGPIDGHFGRHTLRAVKAAQKANGTGGSGIVGPNTLAFLRLSLKPKAADNESPLALPITRNFVGKKEMRKIPDELRLLIEKELFKQGIPTAFVKKDVANIAKLVAEALVALEIREHGGNNKGHLVGLVQGVIGKIIPNGDGQAWCMSLMQVVIAFVEDFLQVESPIISSEHCMTVWHDAQKKGLTTSQPEKGSLIIWVKGLNPLPSLPGHTGLVVGVINRNYVHTVEGNTGSDNMRDGDGCYPRRRSTVATGTLRVCGYVSIFAK
jgi:hypothetical protein